MMFRAPLTQDSLAMHGDHQHHKDTPLSAVNGAPKYDKTWQMLCKLIRLLCHRTVALRLATIAMFRGEMVGSKMGIVWRDRSSFLPDVPPPQVPPFGLQLRPSSSLLLLPPDAILLVSFAFSLLSMSPDVLVMLLPASNMQA